MVTVLAVLPVLLSTTGVVVEVTLQAPALVPVVISVAPESTLMLLSAAVPVPNLNVTSRSSSDLTGWSTSAAKSTV